MKNIIEFRTVIISFCYYIAPIFNVTIGSPYKYKCILICNLNSSSPPSRFWQLPYLTFWFIVRVASSLWLHLKTLPISQLCTYVYTHHIPYCSYSTNIGGQKLWNLFNLPEFYLPNMLTNGILLFYIICWLGSSYQSFLYQNCLR